MSQNETDTKKPSKWITTSWTGKGVRKTEDLYMNDKLMSFKELVIKYDIPRKHFFKYLQVRGFMSFSQYHSLRMPPLSSLEKEVTRDCYGKGLILLLYSMLESGSQVSSEPRLDRGLERGFKEDISMSNWMEACRDAQQRTMKTWLKLP